MGKMKVGDEEDEVGWLRKSAMGNTKVGHCGGGDGEDGGGCEDR